MYLLAGRLEQSDSEEISFEESPHAGMLMFCYRQPEGTVKMKREYLSGFDTENAEYAIPVSEILDYDYDAIFQDGKTSRELLGIEFFETIKKLEPYRGDRLIVREI